MFISAYIFLYTDNVVMPSSHIINNHLKSEIWLQFYTTVFSLVCRTFSNKKSKFFNFYTYSVFYKHP